MLLELSADFEHVRDEYLASPLFNEVIDNLTIAHRKGCHRIAGPPSVLRRLASRLGGDRSGMLRQAAAQHHELSTLKKTITHYAIVEPRADDAVVVRDDGRHIVFHAPPMLFSDVSSAMPARLVCENATDKALYILIAKAYLTTLNARERPDSFSIQGFGGGGSTISDQYIDHANLGVTLAIVDSDIRFPGGALGNTAKALLEAHDRVKVDHVAWAECLPAHEFENLLPPNLVADTINSSDGDFYRSALLTLAERVLGRNEYMFVDTKNGLYICDLIAVGTNSLHAEYLKQCALAFGASKMKCFEEELPRCPKRSECDCCCIAGGGGKLLDRVLEHLEKMTPHKVAEIFFSNGSPVATVWGNLCRLILSFALAGRRRNV